MEIVGYGVSDMLCVALNKYLSPNMNVMAEETRNGPCVAWPTPVLFSNRSPEHRVLYSPTRDANPFFHLFEALWMLAGRRDVEFPAKFVKRIREYSDDGLVLHGAYGHRWRYWFGHDQLRWAIDELRERPNSRRVVISMWDGNVDPIKATAGGKDVPCNTQIYLRLREVGALKALDMTVTCRSNDLVWGAQGANAVHFSILLEVLVAELGVRMGTLYQLSNNLHVYVNQFSDEKLRKIRDELVKEELEDEEDPLPLLQPGETLLDFTIDCTEFCDDSDNDMEYRTKFFREVVDPMFMNWEQRLWEYPVTCPHWEKAGREWIQRRAK
jgi:thymidylate synthase